MVTVKTDNPLRYYIENYIVKGLRNHISSEELPNGSILVREKTTPVELIIPDNLEKQVVKSWVPNV